MKRMRFSLMCMGLSSTVLVGDGSFALDSNKKFLEETEAADWSNLTTPKAFRDILPFENVVMKNQAGMFVNAYVAGKADKGDAITVVTHGNVAKGSTVFLRKASSDKQPSQQEKNEALVFAVTQQNTVKVKNVLLAGADSNARDNAGHTPLMLAAKNGLVDIVTVLLIHGADKELTFEEVGLSYLHGLTEEKSAIDFANEGFSSTKDESKRKKFVTISRLLKSDADLGKLLLIVAQDGEERSVKELLAAGVHADFVNDKGETPLMLAAYGGYLRIVVMLLRASATVDAIDKQGRTALMMAAINGHVAVVRELLVSGAKPDMQDTIGNTALMWALGKGHVEVVQELLARGAKPDVQNAAASTALMMASGEGHIEIVKELLERGVKLDIQNKDGNTALIFASWKGHVEVVETLIKSGAKPDLKNAKGQTALSRAEDEQKSAKTAWGLSHSQREEKKDRYQKIIELLSSSTK